MKVAVLIDLDLCVDFQVDLDLDVVSVNFSDLNIAVICDSKGKKFNLSLCDYSQDS